MQQQNKNNFMGFDTIEINLVSSNDYHPLVQAYTCGPAYAAVALSTVSLYAAFTLGVTQWRTQFRVKMNKVGLTIGAFLLSGISTREASNNRNKIPVVEVLYNQQ